MVLHNNITIMNETEKHAFSIYPEAYSAYNFDSTIMSPNDGATGFAVIGPKWGKVVYVQNIGWVALSDESLAQAVAVAPKRNSS